MRRLWGPASVCFVALELRIGDPNYNHPPTHQPPLVDRHVWLIATVGGPREPVDPIDGTQTSSLASGQLEADCIEFGSGIFPIFLKFA
jgi:hypothetical protein